MYLLEYNLSETEESVHDADSFSIIQTIHRFMRAKLSRDAEGRSYDFNRHISFLVTLTVKKIIISTAFPF